MKKRNEESIPFIFPCFSMDIIDEYFEYSDKKSQIDCEIQLTPGEYVILFYNQFNLSSDFTFQIESSSRLQITKLAQINPSSAPSDSTIVRHDEDSQSLRDSSHTFTLTASILSEPSLTTTRIKHRPRVNSASTTQAIPRDVTERDPSAESSNKLTGSRGKASAPEIYDDFRLPLSSLLSTDNESDIATTSRVMESWDDVEFPKASDDKTSIEQEVNDMENWDEEFDVSISDNQEKTLETEESKHKNQKTEAQQNKEEVEVWDDFDIPDPHPSKTTTNAEKYKEESKKQVEIEEWDDFELPTEKESPNSTLDTNKGQSKKQEEIEEWDDFELPSGTDKSGDSKSTKENKKEEIEDWGDSFEVAPSQPAKALTQISKQDSASTDQEQKPTRPAPKQEIEDWDEDFELAEEKEGKTEENWSEEEEKQIKTPENQIIKSTKEPNPGRSSQRKAAKREETDSWDEYFVTSMENVNINTSKWEDIEISTGNEGEDDFKRENDVFEIKINEEDESMEEMDDISEEQDEESEDNESEEEIGEWNLPTPVSHLLSSNLLRLSSSNALKLDYTGSFTKQTPPQSPHSPNSISYSSFQPFQSTPAYAEGATAFPNPGSVTPSMPAFQPQAPLPVPLSLEEKEEINLQKTEFRKENKQKNKRNKHKRSRTVTHTELKAILLPEPAKSNENQQKKESKSKRKNKFPAIEQIKGKEDASKANKPKKHKRSETTTQTQLEGELGRIPLTKRIGKVEKLISNPIGTSVSLPNKIVSNKINQSNELPFHSSDQSKKYEKSLPENFDKKIKNTKKHRKKLKCSQKSSRHENKGKEDDEDDGGGYHSDTSIDEHIPSSFPFDNLENFNLFKIIELNSLKLCKKYFENSQKSMREIENETNENGDNFILFSIKNSKIKLLKFFISAEILNSRNLFTQKNKITSENIFQVAFTSKNMEIITILLNLIDFSNEQANQNGPYRISGTFPPLQPYTSPLLHQNSPHSDPNPPVSSPESQKRPAASEIIQRSSKFVQEPTAGIFKAQTWTQEDAQVIKRPKSSLQSLQTGFQNPQAAPNGAPATQGANFSFDNGKIKFSEGFSMRMYLIFNKMFDIFNSFHTIQFKSENEKDFRAQVVKHIDFSVFYFNKCKNKKINFENSEKKTVTNIKKLKDILEYKNEMILENECIFPAQNVENVENNIEKKSGKLVKTSEFIEIVEILVEIEEKYYLIQLIYYLKEIQIIQILSNDSSSTAPSLFSIYLIFYDILVYLHSHGAISTPLPPLFPSKNIYFAFFDDFQFENWILNGFQGENCCFILQSPDFLNFRFHLDFIFTWKFNRFSFLPSKCSPAPPDSSPFSISNSMRSFSTCILSFFANCLFSSNLLRSGSSFLFCFDFLADNNITKQQGDGVSWISLSNNSGIFIRM